MTRRHAALLPLALLLHACADPPAGPVDAAAPAEEGGARAAAAEAPEIEELGEPEETVEFTNDHKDSAFHSDAWNSALGFGGGAGGAYGGRAGRARPSSESYAASAPAGFLATDASPLSTFAADVDTASFTNVRRILSEGRLPPADAVRVEEFVNACRYDLAEPAPRQTFAIDAEVGLCPWNPDHDLVRFALSTRPIEAEKLPPCNLVFLVDISGSMQRAEKLPLVKQASDLLVEQLRPQDRVSIVTYAAGVAVALDSAAGDEKARIRAAFRALEPEGGTNGEGGIQAAYELAQKNRVQGINRVILSTDGDFNVGIREPDALEAFIHERKDQGVFLTVLGFGTGNLKDDRLERLANRGNGTYHYVDGLHTARRVLVEEFGAEMMTVAKDVKLQTEWNQDVVRRYRLLGYENRALAAEDFRNDKKDAGEVGAGHVVTALYEVERDRDADRGEAPMVTLRVRYMPPEGTAATEVAHELRAPDGSPAELSANGRVAAVAAALAMALRGDEHVDSLSAARLDELARGIDAARHAELREMVRLASGLLRESADAAPVDPAGAMRAAGG